MLTFIIKPLAALSLATMLALLATGCKLVKTEDVSKFRRGYVEADAATPTDPASAARAMWAPQVLPHLDKAALDFPTLRKAIAADLNAAGKQYGYRAKEEGTPWNFAVKLTGRIVEANTESRAATAGVDTDSDGKADVTLQLGPVLRGTAIRDVLPFVTFNTFKNQIEFATLAKAFNQIAYDAVLAALPRDKLVGKTVSAVGAFSLTSAGAAALVVPVRIEIVGATQ